MTLLFDSGEYLPGVTLLFVSGEYPPDVGGVGDYTDRLRSALDALAWSSSVLSRRHVGRWDVRSLVRLLRVAPSNGVVHIQFQAGAFDLLGDVCLMPALLRRVRPRLNVVTTFHDIRVPYLFPRAGRLRQAAVQLLARTSHAVIAADERDLVALGGPSPRHHHVPIGPNVACAPPAGYDRGAFRASLGVGPDTLVVAYFGLLNASKGLESLVDAFTLIAAKAPGARLLLLGGAVGASDPSDRQTAARLRSRIDAQVVQTGPLAQSAVSGNVIQTGWLAPPALSAYLLAADVALLPYADGASLRRGSLLACAEHGLPIVSTRPVAPEVESVIFTPNDSSPQALAEAVLHVFHEPTERARLHQASLALAQSTAWPRIAAAHIFIYQSLLSGA